MCRSYAMTDAAEVVEFQAVGYGTVRVDPRPPMRENGRLAAGAELAVAVRVGRSGPDPARAKLGSTVGDRTVPVDMAPEILRSRHGR